MAHIVLCDDYAISESQYESYKAMDGALGQQMLHCSMATLISCLAARAMSKCYYQAEVQNSAHLLRHVTSPARCGIFLQFGLSINDTGLISLWYKGQCLVVHFVGVFLHREAPFPSPHGNTETQSSLLQNISCLKSETELQKGAGLMKGFRAQEGI